MTRKFHLGCVLIGSLFMASCSSGGHDDLIAFMADIKSTRSKPVEPIPTFNPYKSFDYSATSLRAPFDRPVVIRDIDNLAQISAPAPDPKRLKEYLEQFNIESLKMVGTLEQHGQMWALLDDGQGNVYYVKEGNYIGKHNGKIVSATPFYIQVIEVVTNGNNGWIERPRTIELRD